MKQFFENESKLSMGRLLSFTLFIVVTFVFIWKAIANDDLTINFSNLIIWGWGIAIGGKAVQAMTEKIGKK